MRIRSVLTFETWPTCHDSLGVAVYPALYLRSVDRNGAQPIWSDSSAPRTSCLSVSPESYLISATQPAEARLRRVDGCSRTMSHPMKILTILIGTLVLNMFDASNCRADEAATEAMLRAERLGGLRLGLSEKD